MYIRIGPELTYNRDPIARHCERGEADRGDLKSTPTAATAGHYKPPALRQGITSEQPFRPSSGLP